MKLFNGKLKITRKRLTKALWVVVVAFVVLTTLFTIAFPGGVPVK